MKKASTRALGGRLIALIIIFEIFREKIRIPLKGSKGDLCEKMKKWVDCLFLLQRELFFGAGLVAMILHAAVPLN